MNDNDINSFSVGLLMVVVGLLVNKDHIKCGALPKCARNPRGGGWSDTALLSVHHILWFLWQQLVSLLAWLDPLTCSDSELPNSVAHKPSCGQAW